MSQPRQPSNDHESRGPDSRTRLPSQPSSRAGSATRNGHSQSRQSTPPPIPYPGLLNDLPVELSLEVIELLLTDAPNPSRTLLNLSHVSRRTRSIINTQAVRVIGSFASRRAAEFATTAQLHKYRDVPFWRAFNRWSKQKGMFKNAAMARSITNMFVDAFLESNDAWEASPNIKTNLKRFASSLTRIHLHCHVNAQSHSGNWAVALGDLTTQYNTSVNATFPSWAKIRMGLRHDLMVRNVPGYLGVADQHPQSTTVADLNLLTRIKIGDVVYDNGLETQETVKTVFNLPQLPAGFAYRSRHAWIVETLADTAGKLAEWRRWNSNCPPEKRAAMEAARPDFNVALTALALEKLEIF